MTEFDRNSEPSVVPNYENRLARDFELALAEGGRFFEGRSEAHATLRRLARLLGESRVGYAVAGGMAYFAHGYRRFTEVVEVIVTPEGLHAAHSALVGRGFFRPFPLSRNLRDAESGVKIEFIVDRKGTGATSPDPLPGFLGTTVDLEGVTYLSVEGLVELSLISSAQPGGRQKDIAVVVELIKSLDLPEAFANRLSEGVRTEYLNLHRELYARQRRYLRFWSPKSAADAGFTLDEALAAGLTFESRGESNEGYLVTTDRSLAKQFGLEDESEFLLDES